MALEELWTRVAEVERRVEVLEGVVRKREEWGSEERKQAEEEEEEERGRREEGGIGQTMLRNMKMLTLAWSISAIPAFISSSPPSTSSRSASGDSTGADTDSDTDTIRNRNRSRNEHRNRHTTSMVPITYTPLLLYKLFWSFKRDSFSYSSCRNTPFSDKKILY